MHKKNKLGHNTSMKKIILIIWIAVIFFLSSQPSNISNNLSTNVTNLILNDSSLNYYFRESMHMMEFLILGLVMITYSKKKDYLLVFISCFILACTDEFFQLFIDGRTCELLDVILDTTGSFIGLTCYHLITHKKLQLNYQKKEA